MNYIDIPEFVSGIQQSEETETEKDAATSKSDTLPAEKETKEEADTEDASTEEEDKEDTSAEKEDKKEIPKKETGKEDISTEKESKDDLPAKETEKDNGSDKETEKDNVSTEKTDMHDTPAKESDTDTADHEVFSIYAVEDMESLTLSEDTLSYIACTDTCLAFGVFFLIGLILARIAWGRFR